MRAFPEVDFWLEQFNQRPDDYLLAKELFDKIIYVDHLDLKVHLHLKLDQLRFKSVPCAVYVERELQKTKALLPPAMYKEERVKVKGKKKYSLRARGAAAQAVQSLKYKQQEIGSEGILAQVLTKQCEKFPESYMFQPTAEEIRARKVRKIIVVTDFIGSGDRVASMLSSLWRVRSVRSWVSLRLIKIYVVCVSGTDVGIAAVERHSSKPVVVKGMECPTIYNSFDGGRSFEMLDLCNRYGGFSPEPLGYKNAAALIAFEHSAPNNLPAIFVKSCAQKRNHWDALFYKRSTEFLWGIHDNIDLCVMEAFQALGLEGIVLSWKYKSLGQVERYAVLITAISSKGYSTINEQIQYSGIPFRCFDLALLYAVKEGWIGPSGRVSRKGRAMVNDLSSNFLVENSPPSFYYPRQLRAPF
ncbi:hypothetical protein IB274_03190 [Pseudomonas sp. PDM18]|uniref:phosphoribosyltransferase-like protein n=1 Tax=Pseudomonas sp. PDM18 TaxID=2769253 RepID=UPI00177EC826|nr:hypothetical protein [Pseudomonas sp. PDM18]MBD9675685.1 hypothetical protein [Pseudomonas sp. PDM18]